jgi:transcription elongation factor SPT5
MRKHFEQGDHVKVVAGVHKGETGLVTSVADHVVHVIGDHSNEEFEVFPRDISLSRDISSGMRQSGLFKVHDLVDIDTHNVGVILKAEKDIFAILTQNGEVRKVPVKEITTKRKFRNPKALDAQRNELQLEDPVKVIEGPHKNKQGTLKHIYRGACFLYSRDILENSGMFVARNHQVLLVGAKKKSTGHNFEGWGFPHGSSRSFNGHRNAISSSWRGPDPLRNAKVLVTRGTHKGIHGIVKDCTDNTARVELSSTSLMITINRQHLCVLEYNSYLLGEEMNFSGCCFSKSGNIIQSNPKADAASIPPHTARYSDFGSDFSLFNSSYSDVSFASQTPAYGQQTPLHDSEGAGYSSAWDPLNTNTPLQPSTPGLTDLGDSYTPQTVKNNFSSDTPLGPPSTGNPPSTPGCPESSLASYDVPTPGYLPHTPGAYASNLPKDYTFSTPLSFGVSTPANYEPTFGPESSEFPRTPSSVLTPTSDTSRSSWLHPDIVVTIGIGPFKGKRGSVRSVHENRTACSVSLDSTPL